MFDTYVAIWMYAAVEAICSIDGTPFIHYLLVDCTVGAQEEGG